MTTQSLDDVQSRHDERNIMLQRVGIKQLRYPMVFDDLGLTQHTHGLFDMTVQLPGDQKGSHLSRFTALLQEYHARDSLVMSLELMPLWHKRMVSLLGSVHGCFSSSFVFYVEKSAPISHEHSLLDYKLTLTVDGPLNSPTTSFKLQVIAHSLCPCSKAISKYGAHNQRSLITVQAQTTHPFSIKALVSLIEQQASCELYNLLKRVDEKYVTEKAYEHPKFSEDIVRDVYQAIKKEYPFLTQLHVESEHVESIHTHNAYASVHDSF